MKFVDKGEFYSCKEENEFKEHKIFNAEQFFTKEQKESPKEIIDIKEISTDNPPISEKKNIFNKEKIEDLAKDASKPVSNVASHAVSESVAVASGATSSVVVVAAAVVISVATTGSLFTNLTKYISKEVGNNYSLVEMDMDKILQESEKLYGLDVKDFSLKIYNSSKSSDAKEYSVKEGKQKYLIPNLEIDTTYTCELVCNKNILGESSSFYKEEFKTSIEQAPIGILDSQNTYISADESSYIFNYSVYLSDYYHTVDNATLYICEQKQDYKNIKEAIDIIESIDENNFYIGSIENIHCESLYLYLVSNIEEDSILLMEEEIKTNIKVTPAEHTSKFEVEEGSLVSNTTPNKISISGNASYIDRNYDYFAYLSTYNADGNIISPQIEAILKVGEDSSSSLFEISSFIDYGTKEYEINICYFDDNETLQIAYQSERMQFSANQDRYLASFDVKGIEDADINYFDDHIEISVDSNFTSEYENYFYELSVVNKDNLILDTYLGDGIARFTIDDSESLNSLKFIYKEVCEFNNGSVYYNTYESSLVDFKNPAIYLSSEPSFDGQYFSIYYEIDTVFALSDTTIDFKVETETETFTYSVENIEEKGTLLLDQSSSELGNTNISATLHFKDYSSSQTLKSKEFNFGTFDLSYYFNIDKVVIDNYHQYGSDNIYVGAYIYSSSRLPSTYKIKVTDNNTINIEEDISSITYVSNISYSETTNLTISILNEEGEVYKNDFVYTLAPNEAYNNYSIPLPLTFPSGYEIAITYNDDDTANVYVDTNFVKADHPEYNINCMIYEDMIEDYDTGKVEYIGRVDTYVEDYFALIEDIERSFYIFEYRVEYTYNDVVYVMYCVNPSGGYFDLLYEEKFYVEAEVATDSSTFNIYNDNCLEIQNYIKINDVEYTFDTFDSGMSSYTLTLQEEVHADYVYLRMNAYHSKYIEFTSKIQMKGNEYFELGVGVNEL